MSDQLYQILTCPTCGTHHGVTPDTAARRVCCGKQLTTGIIPPAGTPIYQPSPDQLADTPLIVTAPPDLTQTAPPEIQS